MDDEPEGSAGSEPRSRAGSQDGKGSSSEEDGGGSIGSSEAGSGADSGESTPTAAAAAPPPPAAVRYVPDSARGTLRLLQGTKEPHLLKLVWSAERSRSAPADAAAGGSKQEGQQQQPLDMFGSAAATGSGGSGSSVARAPHLAHMPAATAAASAARGPIVREDCELWEAAAEFDWELSLPTTEGGSEGGGRTAGSSSSSRSSSDAGIPAGTFEARQLPSGAQLLMVTASGAGSRSSGGSSLRSRTPKPAAAFWLQQHLGPDSLQVPAYGTAPSSAAPAEAAAAAAADAAVSSGAPPETAAPQQAEEQHVTGEAATCPAAVLAAALQRLLGQPPAVDLRCLRKDVKAGAIQVCFVICACCIWLQCPPQAAQQACAPLLGPPCALRTGRSRFGLMQRCRPTSPACLSSTLRRSLPSQWARCRPSLCGTLWAPAPPS